jgi:hypothetical protein
VTAGIPAERVFPQFFHERHRMNSTTLRYRSASLRTLAFALALGSSVLFAAPTSASTIFFNGFETDISGWETPTRVASGTGGITSSAGGFHATTAAGSGDFTRWGGYNYGAGNAVPTLFQEYWTSVDIFLSVGGGWANNTRFDFSSAINNAAGTHLSDFIFNAGFYNDATGPGAGTDRFVISASNNSQPTSAFPKNPGRDPIAINTTGWYTFEHHFYESTGNLFVTMSIFDAANALVNDWTQDTGFAIAAVGGNRYGWFDFNEFSSLALDNSELRTVDATAAVPEPGTLTLLGIGMVGLVRAARKRKQQESRAV